MATEKRRIPQKAALFSTYINMALDYLLITPPGAAQANWERLGITGSEINQLITFRNSNTTYYAKYANKKDTRTTAVKDLFRNNQKLFIAFFQPLLDRIGSSANVTIDDLETFDIKKGPLRDTTRTRKTAPPTHPIVVRIDCMEPAKHKIFYKDEIFSGRRKGENALFAEITFIVRAADSPPDSVDDCTQSVNNGASPAEITHANNQIGKVAFYFLRWVGPTGLVGPWSPMYFAVIS